jgi:hypothetical protein
MNLEKKKPAAKRPATAVPAAKLDAETKSKYEEILETLDNYQGEELGKLVKDLKIVAPGICFAKNRNWKRSHRPSSLQPNV